MLPHGATLADLFRCMTCATQRHLTTRIVNLWKSASEAVCSLGAPLVRLQTPQAHLVERRERLIGNLVARWRWIRDLTTVKSPQDNSCRTESPSSALVYI